MQAITSIGVRHRESQSLFLSNMFELHLVAAPGYGKIHIGIYITALKDAINRFKKLSSSALPRCPEGDDEDQGFNKGEGKRR